MVMTLYACVSMIRGMSASHVEVHRIDRVGWLRASVLGANDGIVSTASLLIGVASASAPHEQLLVAGVAGLVAGAMSMAAGEYVSVGSQYDTEQADLARERAELATQPERELQELTSIYESRGLAQELARQVAEQLMAHDALAAHARDELGVSDATSARPLVAAAASAASFAAGGAVPLLVAWLAPARLTTWVTASVSLVALACMGALAARAGGSSGPKGSLRVAAFGAAAMVATALAGWLVDLAR